METATRSRTAPFVAAAFGLLIIVYLPVIAGLVREWYTDGNYSHGFLVPAISAVLILLHRGKFNEILEPPGTSLTLRKIFLAAVIVCIGLSFVFDFTIAAIITLNAAGWFIIGRAFVFQIRQRRFVGWVDPAGDYSGLFLIAVGLVLFVLANAAAEYFTLRLSLIITLAGMVWLLFGRRFASDIWFELAFLVFMIPLPYVIYYAATFPMQLFATKVTVAILHIIGMSAVQQGNIIHLPGYSLEVAEACSGLRSLISLLALGAVYARLTQKGLPRQLILFVSTIPIAIAANIFRVTFTAVGAYAVSKELAEDFLHELSGMMVFVVAFIMLFIWGAILRIGSKKK
jgi:exosortase